MDDDEFDLATRPHLSRLSAIARRILGDADLASDAVQEALLTLWLSRERPDDLGAWLNRTVVNRSRSLARRRRRRRDHEERARLRRPEGSVRDDPARHAERRDTGRLVREALDRLRPDHRRVLILQGVEGRDYGSIAAALGLPVGTVRSRLHRARAALGEALSRSVPELDGSSDPRP